MSIWTLASTALAKIFLGPTDRSLLLDSRFDCCASLATVAQGQLGSIRSV